MRALRSLGQLLVRRGRDLHRDDSGAVMVVAVAFSLVIVGMVWAVLGTGYRIEMKEGAQSSADAAAFTAAVIRAKGMNIIAFLNLILAVVMGMVVMAQLLPIAALTAAIFITAVAAGCGPWCISCCEWIPSAINAWSTYFRIENRNDSVIRMGRNIGRFVTTTQDIVNTGSALASLWAAYDVGTDRVYGPNLQTLPWPPLEPGACDDASSNPLSSTIARFGICLPVRRQRSQELCDRAVGFFQTGNQQHCYRRLRCSWRRGCRWERTCNNIGTASPINPGHAWYFLISALYSSDWRVQGFIVGSGAFWLAVLGRSYCLNEQGDEDMQPLELASDWQTRVSMRAFTVRPGDGASGRMRNVTVATPGNDDAFTMPGMLAFAQARYENAFQRNTSDRMFEMDWRAHLERFTFSGQDPSYNRGNIFGNQIIGPMLDQLFAGIPSILSANDMGLGFENALILH